MVMVLLSWFYYLQSQVNEPIVPDLINQGAYLNRNQFKKALHCDGFIVRGNGFNPLLNRNQ